MHGAGRKDATLLLVTDQSLPAKHQLMNVAVLSSPQHSLVDAPEHNLYHPVVRLMRLMDSLMKEGLSASVSRVPSMTVGTPRLFNISAVPYTLDRHVVQQQTMQSISLALLVRMENCEPLIPASYHIHMSDVREHQCQSMLCRQRSGSRKLLLTLRLCSRYATQWLQCYVPLTRKCAQCEYSF